MRADDSREDDNDDDITQFMTAAYTADDQASLSGHVSVGDDGRHTNITQVAVDSGSSVEHHSISDSSAKLKSAAVRLRNAHSNLKGTLQAVM